MIGDGLIINDIPELKHLEPLLKDWKVILCVKNDNGKLLRDIRPVQKWGSINWCIANKGHFESYVKNSKTFQYIFLKNRLKESHGTWIPTYSYGSEYGAHHTETRFQRIGLTVYELTNLDNESFFKKLFFSTRITSFDNSNRPIKNLRELNSATGGLNIHKIHKEVMSVVRKGKDVINALLPDESPRKKPMTKKIKTTSVPKSTTESNMYSKNENSDPFSISLSDYLEFVNSKSQPIVQHSDYFYPVKISEPIIDNDLYMTSGEDLYLTIPSVKTVNHDLRSIISKDNKSTLIFSLKTRVRNIRSFNYMRVSSSGVTNYISCSEGAYWYYVPGLDLWVCPKLYHKLENSDNYWITSYEFKTLNGTFAR